MSRLKLFLGEETSHAPRVTSVPFPDNSSLSACHDSVTTAEFPALLDYESHADRWRKYRNSPLDRARSLRHNDRCPHCRHGLVEPLELADGVRSRNHQPIPGTATLVGFHCLACHWEWPA